MVDDEAPIVKMTTRLLENLGYSVSSSVSSSDALELFRSDPKKYDLVITDMTMPEMAGDLLAVEVLKIRPDIPVILCTGFSRQLSEEKLRENGIRALLNKPITELDLAVTIRKVLDPIKR